MSRSGNPVQIDAVLAKDYPRAIKEAYVGAVRRTHASERHHQLLRLGEAGLAYLASLAFSDYRQARRSNPDRAVEQWIASVSRVTTGEYLHLFRLTQKALGRPELFGIKRYEVNVKLADAARLVAAIQAVDYAQRVGATSVRAAIDEGLRSPQKSVRWLSFWNGFVEYRNRVIHADDKGWPIDAEGYFALMTPLLEAALVEALRTEYIAHILLEYPVADLTDVRRSGAEWALEFDGEYRGAPLLMEIRQEAAPETWQTEVGAGYVLGSHASGEWFVHARFFDLKRQGFPTGQDGLGQMEDPLPTERASPRQPKLGSTQESAVTPALHHPEAVGHAHGPSRLSDGARELQDAPPLADASRGGDAITRGPLGEPATREPWFPSFSPWMLWGICSLGFLAWVGFLLVATRFRLAQLRKWGIVYGIWSLIVAAIAASVGDSEAYPVLDAIGATLWVGLLVVTTTHAFVVNPTIRRLRRAESGGS